MSGMVVNNPRAIDVSNSQYMLAQRGLTVVRKAQLYPQSYLS
jgi:hypothetical protein